MRIGMCENQRLGKWEQTTKTQTHNSREANSNPLKCFGQYIILQ